MNLMCVSRCGVVGVLVVAAMGAAAGAEVRYVRASLATGADSGTGWGDAFRGRDGLSRALSVAVAGDEVWVAAGTYVPTISGDRATSFVLRSGVAIYGGFAGSETARDQRDLGTNVTVLSGDLSGNDAPAPSTTGTEENSYHVVHAGIANTSGILDGFTISAGNANGLLAEDKDRGGGIIAISAAPTIVNCRIVNNRCSFGGGGIYMRMASPTITGCTIEANNGGSFGGACDMFSSCSPVWTRCSIIGNRAVRAGGVEVFGNCQPQFINCVFVGNTSTSTNIGQSGGGGLYIASNSMVTLRNCTIVGNTTTAAGGGVRASASDVQIYNSIVYANTGPNAATTGQQLVGATFTVRSSDVQGGYAGTGNIDLAPIYENAGLGDYRPGAGSPGIDAGNNAYVLASMTTDRSGKTRLVNDPNITDTGAGTAPIVDLGCFERQLPPPPACAADFNGVGGVTVQDIFDFLDAFFRNDLRANINGVGGVTVQDIFDYVGAYFTGC